MDPSVMCMPHSRMLGDRNASVQRKLPAKRSAAVEEARSFMVTNPFL